MHPYREQFPDDFANYFRSKFIKAVKDPSHCPRVATSLDDAGRESVIGFAHWIRQSTNDDNSPQPTTSGGEKNENRAADPHKLDVLDRAGELTKHYWSGSRANTYYLNLLGVDPAHQKKGIGRTLTMEGIKLAKQNGICASVIASSAGHYLYASCGFKDVGWATEGTENPLRHLQSGQIMFWEEFPSEQ